ncbi:hypothetical protein NZD89_04735 [Alicyclobacillus fastidiosus]|uniref:Uncharacterized protein n=1 Tax=Alicyclobacillus fastidiosus TaxID=392011 RepID=A0ABY6ZIJ6_9BACL|nr:hypothetical protein [Alicyclobacillus fastidiosus]WAH42743.1 hypothetical protein NZD89_04735 [Alicyclobacillus fastidiosus]
MASSPAASSVFVSTVPERVRDRVMGTIAARFPNAMPLGMAFGWCDPRGLKRRKVQTRATAFTIERPSPTATHRPVRLQD